MPPEHLQLGIAAAVADKRRAGAVGRKTLGLQYEGQPVVAEVDRGEHPAFGDPQLEDELEAGNLESGVGDSERLVKRKLHRAVEDGSDGRGDPRSALGRREVAPRDHEVGAVSGAKVAVARHGLRPSAPAT